MSCLPSPHRAERRARFETAPTRSTRFSTQPANRNRIDGDLPITTCSNCFRPSRSVLPWGWTFEEAATPLVARNAQGASGETLQQFTLENRRKTAGSSAILAALLRHPTYALASTLLEAKHRCNKKLQPGCAEAVEDENSLWKAKEKTGKTAADSSRRQLKPGEVLTAPSAASRI